MAIDLTGLSLGNFWEWLKENKVGAWIGGLIPILSLVRWNAISNPYTDVMFTCVTGFDSYGCGFGKFITNPYHLIIIIIGIIIGAFIYSKLKRE